MRGTYVETFEDSPGGWIGVNGNGNTGARRLKIVDGALVSSSPWWIDYNHAPPGVGYLHLLFALHTRIPPSFSAQFKEAGGGTNRFVEGGFPLDFTDAEITVRLKGELESRGAQLVFLAQARVGSHIVGHLLTGQPLQVTPDWSEQTIRLTPDPAQWTPLGVRHDRGESYALGNVEDVLKNLDVDFMFLLHPLDVVPLPPIEADPHLLKAGEEYSVDQSRLPSGFVMMDEIRIRFGEEKS